MANVRRPTRSATSASSTPKGTGRSNAINSRIDKTKPSSSSITVKSGKESRSSKAQKKVSQSLTSQKLPNKQRTPLKSLPKVAQRPPKNSVNQKKNQAKQNQTSSFARNVAKKKDISKLPPCQEEVVKSAQRKTDAKATRTTFGEGPHSQLRSSSVRRGKANLPTKKTAHQSNKAPLALGSDKSLSQISPAQKRVFSSPLQSPKNAKSRRLTEKLPEALHPADDCIILDQVKNNSREEPKPNSEEKKSNVSVSLLTKSISNANNAAAKSPDSELNGQFLRRKWFSLKTRGGLTCLRSAILSPEEVANVVLQHTMVESSKQHDINFFTTKLMMHLSNRLPPTKSRSSHEELADFNSAKTTIAKPQCSQESSKGGSPANRLRQGKCSVSDKISHLSKDASKVIVTPNSPPKSNKPSSKLIAVTRHADGTLSKKQEREIALQQLKNL